MRINACGLAAILTLVGCSSGSSDAVPEAATQEVPDLSAAAAEAEAAPASEAATTPNAAAKPAKVTAFASFADESSKLHRLVNCSDGKTTRTQGFPDLWGCIGGSAQTVKLFVNESEVDGQVENVKYMWNDWTNDIGYGLHSDRQLAQTWAKSVARAYAPEHEKALITAFNGKENITIDSGKFTVAYTYHQGPAIGERMFVVSAN